MKKAISKLTSLLLLVSTLICLVCCTDLSSDTSSETIEVDDDTKIRSACYGLDIDKYVSKSVEYWDITVSHSEVKKLVDEELDRLHKEHPYLPQEIKDPYYEAAVADAIDIRYSSKPSSEQTNISEDTLKKLSNISDESPLRIELDEQSPFIGAKSNDTIVINYTFPEDYSIEELRSLEFEFTVKVFSIYSVKDSNEMSEDEVIRACTNYRSLDKFVSDRTVYYTRELAYERCIASLQVTSYEDGTYSDEQLIIEYLFQDLGLVLKYDVYSQKANEAYPSGDFPDHTGTRGKFETDKGKLVSQESAVHVYWAMFDKTISPLSVPLIDELIFEAEKALVINELVSKQISIAP